MSETVTLYKCDKCQKVITNPEDGLVVHGNIYVADPETNGGVVGNNFPTNNEECKFETVEEAVKKSAYCNPCFISICLPKIRLAR